MRNSNHFLLTTAILFIFCNYKDLNMIQSIAYILICNFLGIFLAAILVSDEKDDN